MERYMAMVNTAAPHAGLIRIGEILTEAQAEALGDKKIGELIERGVLEVYETGMNPVREEQTESDETEPAGKVETPVPETGAEENEEVDALELATMDDIVSDEVPLSTSGRSGTRRVRKGA